MDCAGSRPAGQQSVSVSHVMRVQPRPECYLCRTAGGLRYESLNDRLFGSGGSWNIRACGNADCGLMWLDPMPLPEDIGEAYADYYTHDDAPDRTGHPLYGLFTAANDGYLATRHGYFESGLSVWKKLAGILLWLHPGRRAVADLSVMWLDALPQGRLLDVGCGSGWLMKGMTRLGWVVEGVDLDPQAVQSARAKGMQVHLGHLNGLALPAESYDAVTMSHFIEHVHDPISVVGECRRLLKPGGRLVIVTPNTRSLGHRLYGKDWMHLDPPRHLHLFNTDALGEAVRRAGFGKLRVWTSLRDAYGMFLGSRSLRRSGRHAMGAPQSAPVRWWARGAELFEWLALKVNGDLGEEIVVIAEKQ